MQIELSDGWTWASGGALALDIGIDQAIIHRSRDAEAQGAISQLEQLQTLQSISASVRYGLSRNGNG